MSRELIDRIAEKLEQVSDDNEGENACFAKRKGSIPAV